MNDSVQVQEPVATSEVRAPFIDAQISIREYLHIIRTRWWALAGTFVISVAVVGMVALSQVPIYRSTGLLLIEPRKPNVANVNVQEVYDMTMGLNTAEYYRTQFEILKSRRIVEPVAETLRAKYPTQSLSLGMITIDPVPSSRLVRVSVDSSDRVFATDAVNTLLDHYIDDTAQRSSGVSDRGLQKLQEIEAELRPKYEDAVRAEQQFRDENKLSALDEAQSSTGQQLKFLSEELSRVRVLRTKATADLHAAQAAIESGTFANFTSEAGSMTVAGNVKLELLKLQISRAELAKRVTPSHKELQLLDSQIKTLADTLASERNGYLATLRANLDVAAAQEVALQDEVDAAEGKLKELDRKAIKLQLLRREAESVSNSYKNVTQRIAEVTIAIATGAKENSVYIIDRAVAPDTPIRPDKMRSMMIGAIAGLLGGIAMCFVLERLNNTVKGPADIERLLGFPLLGSVPRVAATPKAPATNGNGAPGVPLELTALSQPRGPLAESFRTIRTALSFTLPPGTHHALVITSAAPREGKSFSSVNLAYALAQTGKRVLLVDADLRRPRLHDIFSAPRDESGLSTTLAGSDSLSSLAAVRRTPVPTLDLMPAGPIPPNPAELLQGEGMKMFLDQAREAYDWVVVDAPPVLSVADASIIFAQTKHALLVVRALVSDKGAAVRAKEILSRTPGRVSGVILNDAHAGSGYGYYYRYGYGYGYGYGYHSHDAPKTTTPADQAPKSAKG